MEFFFEDLDDTDLKVVYAEATNVAGGEFTAWCRYCLEVMEAAQAALKLRGLPIPTAEEIVQIITPT